jgi:hypothetical protein
MNMRQILLGFVVVSIFLSTVSFAQPAPEQAAVAQKVARPTPPAGQKEWMVLIKKQALARKAFNEQLKAERDAFLKDHPEMAALVQDQMERGKNLAYKRRAALKKLQASPKQETTPANQQ